MRIIYRVLPGALLAAIFLAACQGAGQAVATPTPAAQWETFHSNEGGFSVLFPTPPEKHLWSDAQSYGGIYTSTYQGMTYNAMFNILADNSLTSPQLLEKVRDDQAAALKAQVLSSDPIEFNGYPGLSYSFAIPESKTLPDGGITQGRIYHVNNHVYLIYHTGPKKNSLLPDVKQYLGSLKVDGMVEQPTPVPVAPYAVVAPTGWQTFTSEREGFSVLLPTQPKREVIGNDKKMEVVKYWVTSDHDAYSVGVFTLKDPALAQARLTALLDLAKESFFKGQLGVIQNEDPIQLGPYTGIEVVAQQPKSEKQPNESQLRARLYLVGKHLYFIMALTAGKETPAEVQPFLDSFKLLESK